MLILSYANLSSANLTEIVIKGTIFANVVGLNLAKCLEKVIHKGPSIVDHKNLIQGENKLPEIFLMGVGFKKWEIESAKLNNQDLSSLEITAIVREIDRLRNTSPIQLYNLFISYSSSDNEFIDYLDRILRQKDITFWRDVHDMVARTIRKTNRQRHSTQSDIFIDFIQKRLRIRLGSIRSQKSARTRKETQPPCSLSNLLGRLLEKRPMA